MILFKTFNNIPLIRIKGLYGHCGKCAYSLSLQEVDEKIDVTLIFVH